MKHIKKAVYAIMSFVLMAPAVVSAQSTIGAGWQSGLDNAETASLPEGTIFGIIQTTMNWLLAILGFLGVIGFVIAGILYLTAAGNEDQIGQAKKAMTYSIFGVIVALIGFVIIQAVDTWLDASQSAF